MARWPHAPSGSYPRGSEAVADLRGAEVLLDCLLVGKPLGRQEAGERGHRAAVPEEPSREGPVGARSRPAFCPWTEQPAGGTLSLDPPPKSLPHSTASPSAPPGPCLSAAGGHWPSARVAAVWIPPGKGRLRRTDAGQRPERRGHTCRGDYSR